MTTDLTDLKAEPETKWLFAPVTTEPTDLKDEPEEPVAPVTMKPTGQKDEPIVV